MKEEKFIAYRDRINNCWYMFGKNNILYSAPFGHFVTENCCNNCADMLHGKDVFVDNTFYKQSKIKHPDVNLLLLVGWMDADTMTVTKEKLSEYYDRVILNSKLLSWRDEYELMLEYLMNIDKFTNSKTSMQDLFSIYNHFKYFNTSVCSDIYHYEPDRIKRNEFMDKQYNKMVVYKGMQMIPLESGDVPTECFEFQEFFDIFILDLWEFLFNPACRNKKLLKCENCGSLFYSSNNQAKYCDICRQPEIMGKIRYKNRKKNTVRNLHHDIVTKLYSAGNGKEKSPNEISNAFLEESNYYWDIVQGKEVTPNPLYQEHIKTESQYKKWLENKLNSL
ncbi:MAG: hypothetical protein NC548_36565 [Lachnospiraceae bacterium]|nr:hypothetical protein [Lachnospiraceae bacterium]